MQTQQKPQTKRLPSHDAFTVVENGQKGYWLKVGAAFTNTDGSLNVTLNAFPANGRLQLRLRKDDR